MVKLKKKQLDIYETIKKSMNSSPVAIDKSLKIKKIRFNNSVEPKGLYDRQMLTKIFSDYIYAYMYTSKEKLPISPTVMFILSDINKKGNPICVPFTIQEYILEQVEGFIALLAEQFPPELYNLEMAIYARFDRDYVTLPNFKIMFSARDGGGSSAHTVYQYNQLDTDNLLTHYQTKVKQFDQWLSGADSFCDPYLEAILGAYYSHVSLNRLNQNVKN